MKPNLPDNVRTVRSNGTSIRGVKNNNWNQLVAFESREGEEKTTQVLQFRQDVENFWSQPEKFEFLDENGQQRHHVPDYKVLFKDGHTEIWDVMSRSRLSDKDNLLRMAGTRKICEQRGWNYVVIIIEDLPQGTEYANIDALYGYRATGLFNEQIMNLAISVIDTRGKTSLKYLVDEIVSSTGLLEKNVCAYVLHLVWRNIIKVDLKKEMILIKASINPLVIVTK